MGHERTLYLRARIRFICILSHFEINKCVETLKICFICHGANIIAFWHEITVRQAFAKRFMNLFCSCICRWRHYPANDGVTSCHFVSSLPKLRTFLPFRMESGMARLQAVNMFDGIAQSYLCKCVWIFARNWTQMPSALEILNRLFWMLMMHMLCVRWQRWSRTPKYNYIDWRSDLNEKLDNDVTMITATRLL